MRDIAHGLIYRYTLSNNELDDGRGLFYSLLTELSFPLKFNPLPLLNSIHMETQFIYFPLKNKYHSIIIIDI